jgi:hypothetical protein
LVAVSFNVSSPAYLLHRRFSLYYFLPLHRSHPIKRRQDNEKTTKRRWATIQSCCRPRRPWRRISEARVITNEIESHF